MAYLRYPLTNFFTNLKAKNITTLKKLILVFGWLIVEQNALKCLVCNHLKKNQFYDKKLTEITNVNISINFELTYTIVHIQYNTRKNLQFFKKHLNDFF